MLGTRREREKGRDSQEKRNEGKKEEKTDRRRKQNQPPQPRQLICIWGKKRTKQNEEQKKNTGSGPLTQLPGPFVLRPAWISVNFLIVARGTDLAAVLMA